MQEFATEQEALDFLASRIAAEAERENLPLSEVERKMLYFSETGWTLPDMAKVSADFDQDYDQDEYERRIARLIAKITAEHHGHNDEEEEKWDAAVDKLSGSDHYLQVMLHAAHMSRASFLPTFEPPAVRPPHDVLKLFLTALIVIFGIWGLMAMTDWIIGPRLWELPDWLSEERNRSGLVILIVVALVFGPKLWRALGLPPIRK